MHIAATFRSDFDPPLTKPGAKIRYSVLESITLSIFPFCKDSHVVSKQSQSDVRINRHIINKLKSFSPKTDPCETPQIKYVYGRKRNRTIRKIGVKNFN